MKNSPNIEKICFYCEHSSSLLTDEQVLCSRKGVVSSEYKCRKFIYDPLKRAPKRPPKLDLEGIDLTEN
jgi:hypothetical protein